MTNLSVALIAASDSNLFDIPIHYSRDNTEDFISKLNNDDTNTLTYGAHAARRAVRVHSAIATILVSQPTDEVVAVGASRSKYGLLTIYISASGERASLSMLYKARLHLEGVWERLGSLVDEHPQQGTESPQDMDMSSDDKVFDLMLYVYRHSMERVIERFTKGDLLGVGDFIAEAVCAPAAYVKDDAPESQGQAYVLRSELITLRFFWAVLLTVRAYQENKSDDNLQEFIAAIDVICKKLGALGDSVWGEASDSLFSRCDRLLKERITTRLEKPVAFARFWKKVFALHRAIKQLLYLTASNTMRSQLKGPFAVESVPPQKGLFEYDLGDDSFRAVFNRVPHRGITRLLPPKSMPGSAIQSDKSSGSPMDISSEGSSHRMTGSSDSDSSQLTYDRFIARYRTKRPL